jgi:hypothetical protein
MPAEMESGRARLEELLYMGEAVKAAMVMSNEWGEKTLGKQDAEMILVKLKTFMMLV